MILVPPLFTPKDVPENLVYDASPEKIYYLFHELFEYLRSSCLYLQTNMFYNMLIL